MPGVFSSRSSHMPYVCSLFSRYLSRLVWSRRGLLTHFVWARCSCGICHAWRTLVAVFPHALRGFVVLLGGGGRSTSSQVERSRSVERDNMQLQSIACNTTGYLRSTRRTTPVELPSFPNLPNRRTEETKVIAERKFCTRMQKANKRGK